LDKEIAFATKTAPWQRLFAMPPLSTVYPEDERLFLGNLFRACREAGGRALLVGGCVRSALLGETAYDFDVEVFGLAPGQIEAVLRPLCGIEKVGRSFGIYKLRGHNIDVGLPRRERKTGNHHRDFAVDVDPALSLAEAAQRRDFTVNAVYHDLLEDRIEDPLGGVVDLRRQLLRHCSERFVEDPLRVLRGMQLAARLEASLAPETERLAATLDPSDLAPERYRLEWEKLLTMGQRPSLGLDLLRRTGWTRHFPELQAMIGCPQDPRWHPEGDVWEHTLHCLDAFARNRAGPQEDDLVAGLAVLCHDMGKPVTTEITDEAIRSPGHDKAGSRIARAFLEKLRFPTRIIDKVLPLVSCHMRPAVLFRDGSSNAAVRRLARDCGRLDLLLRVFLADAAGRPPQGAGNAPKAADWLRERARSLSVETAGPVPLVRGQDVLAHGWSPGPPVGRVLARAYEAQLEGAFEDREGALGWLRHHLAQFPGKESSRER